MSAESEYHELLYYTLSLEDKEFIHQHVVDVYAAQTADKNTKPITLFFALAGLYLLIHENHGGKQVQNAHLKMAGKTKGFIQIDLPNQRGEISVSDVLSATPGRRENQNDFCLVPVGMAHLLDTARESDGNDAAAFVNSVKSGQRQRG